MWSIVYFFSLGFLDTLSANSVIVAKLIKSSVSRKESNWNEIKAVTIFFPTLFSSGLIKLLVVVVIVSVNFIWVINWNRSNIGWPNYVLIYLSWATHTHTPYWKLVNFEFYFIAFNVLLLVTVIVLKQHSWFHTVDSLLLFLPFFLLTFYESQTEIHWFTGGKRKVSTSDIKNFHLIAVTAATAIITAPAAINAQLVLTFFHFTLLSRTLEQKKMRQSLCVMYSLPMPCIWFVVVSSFLIHIDLTLANTCKRKHSMRLDW